MGKGCQGLHGVCIVFWHVRLFSIFQQPVISMNPVMILRRVRTANAKEQTGNEVVSVYVELWTAKLNVWKVNQYGILGNINLKNEIKSAQHSTINLHWSANVFISFSAKTRQDFNIIKRPMGHIVYSRNQFKSKTYLSKITNI